MIKSEQHGDSVMHGTSEACETLTYIDTLIAYVLILGSAIME